MPGILEGIKVLSWTVVYAGPMATAMLGDMGAEIIKIEEPGRGDMMRQLWKGIPTRDRQKELPGQRSVTFELCNRNTKSITLDLSKEKGREILCRLVEKCDVFFTNVHRAAKKWSLDYATLSQYNPRIIYCMMTGYGPEGPDWGLSGYDPVAQARSGMMGVIADPPVLPNAPVLDHAASVLASYGVVAALLARERFGVGQEVNVSLLSAGINLISGEMARVLMGSGETTRHERTKTANPLRNYYRCADGRWLMAANTPPDRYWPSFCKALGIENLEKDPRFESGEVRGRNAPELISILDSIFAKKTSTEWLEAFKKYPDLSFSPINSCADVVNDSQVVANNYLVDVCHPALGQIKLPGFPIAFSRTPAAVTSCAPELGTHTEQVLVEMAGCSQQELESLRREGVV